MAKMTLSPPWAIFYREIQALFGEDPEIHVVYDEENEVVKIYVENSEKAEILSQLLPTKKMFGRVALDIQVIPADGKKYSTELPEKVDATMFETAFKGNPVFSYAKTFPNLFGFVVTYVVFEPEVVQFYTDDISDINGLKSTLFEDVARDVFEGVQVNFCTDLIREDVCGCV